MSEPGVACSFCGKSAEEAGQIFENEEKTAAICAGCVSIFAQNIDDGSGE